MWFTSDNASGAAPEIMEAVARANAGFADSYGAEVAMARVAARLREIFEAPEAAVLLVATGTAANALSLACLCPPWGAVYCHREAHVAVHECGAPEFYTGGAKLVPLAGAHGRIAPEALEAALAAPVDIHTVQPAALSLTNATEAGTSYSPEATARLAGIARRHGLGVHLDGARFANGLVHLGCTPAEMTWKAGVDVVSFGGTKNGCLGVEAVLLFDPVRAGQFEPRRKRAGHLFSKHRFLSAQMEAYLADDLWLDLAARANARAAELAAGLGRVPEARVVHPVEANAVFVELPRELHRRAEAAGARYHLWDEGTEPGRVAARLVCSWSTSAEDVAGLLAAVGAEPA